MKVKKAVQVVVATLMTLLILTVGASSALAAEIEGGNTYTLAQGQTVEDDLYVGAGTITIAGNVNGDAIVAGGTVDVNGSVAEDLMAAGGNINVRGPVEDDMRLAGGNIFVSSSASGDILAAGGNFDLAASGSAGRDVLVGTGTTRIAGNVGRDLLGGAGNLTILGTVQGDVDVEVETLTVGPEARIEGDLTYHSANAANIAEGAVISGEVTRLEPTWRVEPDRPTPGGVLGLIIDRLRYLVAPIILGVILLLLVPRMLDYTSGAIRRYPWSTLGWGVLVLVVTPLIGLLVLIATIFLGGVAIPVTIFSIYVLLLMVAIVFVATFLGKLILSGWQAEHRWWLLVSLVVGSVILAVLTVLPWVGPWITLLVIIFGIGAIVTTGIEALGRARTEGMA